MAIVYADSADHPAIDEVTGDIVYARLENAVEEVPTGYAPHQLDQWSAAARTWSTGGAPDGLPYVDKAPPAKQPRETFIFFINGAKVRAPAGAMALIERLRG